MYYVYSDYTDFTVIVYNALRSSGNISPSSFMVENIIHEINCFVKFNTGLPLFSEGMLTDTGVSATSPDIKSVLADEVSMCAVAYKTAMILRSSKNDLYVDRSIFFTRVDVLYRCVKYLRSKDLSSVYNTSSKLTTDAKVCLQVSIFTQLIEESGFITSELSTFERAMLCTVYFDEYF